MNRAQFEQFRTQHAKDRLRSQKDRLKSQKDYVKSQRDRLKSQKNRASPPPPDKAVLAEIDEWLRKYPIMIAKCSHLTRADIEAKLLRSPDKKVSLVPDDSVVADLLTLNVDTLGLVMDEDRKIDGKYWEVSNDLVNQCLNELDTLIFKPMERARAAGVDLQERLATLHRADFEGVVRDHPDTVRRWGHLTRAQVEGDLKRSSEEAATWVPIDSALIAWMKMSPDIGNVDWKRARPEDDHYKITNDLVDRCLAALDTALFLPIQGARAAGVDVDAAIAGLKQAHEQREDEERRAQAARDLDAERTQMERDMEGRETQLKRAEEAQHERNAEEKEQREESAKTWYQKQAEHRAAAAEQRERYEKMRTHIQAELREERDELKKERLVRCAHCTKKDPQYQCAVCLDALYCSGPCQQIDWVMHHSRVCGRRVALPPPRPGLVGRVAARLGWERAPPSSPDLITFPREETAPSAPPAAGKTSYGLDELDSVDGGIPPSKSSAPPAGKTSYALPEASAPPAESAVTGMAADTYGEPVQDLTRECVVCHDRPVAIILPECGHACMCAQCEKAIATHECPMCRAPYERVVLVRVA